MTPAEAAYVKEWMNAGQEDLDVTQLIIAEGPYMLNSACFHCQQAIEKFLKAFLISRKKEFPKTHNLDHLRELCIHEDIGFSQFDVGDYENFAVRNRYPHDNELPDIDQVKILYTGACDIRDFVQGLI